MAYLAGSLFGAGSDTTAVAIMVVVMAAACHAEAQEKVQEELDVVIGRDRGASRCRSSSESNKTQPESYSPHIRRLQLPPADRGIHARVSSLEARDDTRIRTPCIDGHRLRTFSSVLGDVLVLTTP